MDLVEVKDSVEGVEVRAGFSVADLGNIVADAGGLRAGDFFAKKSRYAGGGVSGVLRGSTGLRTVGEATRGLAISDGNVADCGVSSVGRAGRAIVVAMIANVAQGGYQVQDKRLDQSLGQGGRGRETCSTLRTLGSGSSLELLQRSRVEREKKGVK